MVAKNHGAFFKNPTIAVLTTDSYGLVGVNQTVIPAGSQVEIADVPYDSYRYLHVLSTPESKYPQGEYVKVMEAHLGDYL